MGEVKVIEIGESVFAENDTAAESIRNQMKNQGTFFLNVMSGPGSGKTTTLSAIINRLKGKYKIGEMDVDIESSIDAQRVADATGVESIQIHNMGLCHIDADMTKRALKEYDTTDLDLLILENIGNLVCPAEFDVGQNKEVVILSVPEGDDKPLKYPLMFKVGDILLVNKFDTRTVFDFSINKLCDSLNYANPSLKVIPISAKTGDGFDDWIEWLEKQITLSKEENK